MACTQILCANPRFAFQNDTVPWDGHVSMKIMLRIDVIRSVPAYSTPDSIKTSIVSEYLPAFPSLCLMTEHIRWMIRPVESKVRAAEMK